MAKTYVPTICDQVHDLAVFIARYRAVIRPAISTIDPELLPLFDALDAAVTALDSYRETLCPTTD